MSAPVRDVIPTAMLDECWSPIHTPFWLYEASHFIRLGSITALERLDLSVLGSDVDDPSARTERLSFWSIFRLRAYDTLSPAAFRRMLDDDTLVLWEDHVDSYLMGHFGGYLSVSAAITITLTCTPEPTLIPTHDWKALGRPFLSSAIWAASCLRSHRMRSHPFPGPR